jgi:hypothetical protein
VPLHIESNLKLTESIKSILETKQLTLHRVSEKSARLFGRGSPYYVPHNLYYDLRRGNFSPSLFQLVAFSRLSNYRLRDWLRIFGFDIEAIPRLQIQLGSKRTAYLDSFLDDPHSVIPWFRDRQTSIIPTSIGPVARWLEAAKPRSVRSLSGIEDRRFVYVVIGGEDAFAFPHLLPGSVVRVNCGIASEAFSRVTEEDSEDLFLIEHAKGLCCCRIRSAERGRLVAVSAQLPYARMEFMVPEQARIVGVADLEIRRLGLPQVTSVPSGLATRSKAGMLSDRPARLGPLLRLARLAMGLSFRAASAKSRDLANLIGDERYFAASGSLSDYETLNSAPRHFHKMIAFSVIYSLPLKVILHALDLDLDEPGREPMPDLLTARSSAVGTGHIARSECGEQAGFARDLFEELQGVPVFLRKALGAIASLPRLSLKDIFYLGKTPGLVHPFLAGGVLAAVNRQKKKLNEGGSKPFWEQPLYIILKRDGTYHCGFCSRENTSLVIHTYPNAIHRQEQIREQDVEVIGKITAILGRLR